MTDRTTVQFTVKADDFKREVELFEEECFDDQTQDSEGNFVYLSHYDTSASVFEIEKHLRDKGISYDKIIHGTSYNKEENIYFRGSADGNHSVKEFKGNAANMIDINDVIAAYKDGNLEPYLEKMKQEVQVQPM